MTKTNSILEIGDMCFTKKGRARIVGQNGERHWVVLLEESSDCTSQSINKALCEPLVETEFEVGDEVRSQLRNDGGFEGKVTGYEMATNRAVCISSRIGGYSNDRTRFAYKINEIEKLGTGKLVLVAGATYKLNGHRVVRCVVSNTGEDQVCFLDEHESRIISGSVPSTTTYEHLQKIMKIVRIQFLGK